MYIDVCVLMKKIQMEKNMAYLWKQRHTVALNQVYFTMKALPKV